MGNDIWYAYCVACTVAKHHMLIKNVSNQRSSLCTAANHSFHHLLQFTICRSEAVLRRLNKTLMISHPNNLHKKIDPINTMLCNTNELWRYCLKILLYISGGFDLAKSDSTEGRIITFGTPNALDSFCVALNTLDSLTFFTVNMYLPIRSTGLCRLYWYQGLAAGINRHTLSASLTLSSL